jgi:hypothetical protein
MQEQIDFHSISLGDRGRTKYEGVEELADDIEAVGLIQPLVLQAWYNVDDLNDVKYLLNVGGRRYHALKLLIEQGRLPSTLYHATTCEPLRPGYILKGEATPLQNLLTEISENLRRHNLSWQDECRLLVKAYWVAKLEGSRNGEDILMRDFGHTLGCGYAKLQAAEVVIDELNKNPKRFESCDSIRAAYSLLLKENANFIAKLASEKILAKSNGGDAIATGAADSTKLPSDPTEGPSLVQSVSRPTVPFSEQFACCNGLTHLHLMIGRGLTVDHIITDPDYAVPVERLEAGSNDPAAGVAQDSIEASLKDLHSFLNHSYYVVKPSGFLIFFYDLDHHEKLQVWATGAGWLVQRWPLIWHKTDYRSNAAPSHNFCKNIEYAMVCRKPAATLAKVQMSSVISLPTGDAPKVFNHPFAKPEALWHRLYDAVAIKGQSVLDPFMGSATGPCAAATFGLQPFGTELKEEHFANAVVNLKRTYNKLLGPCDFN